MNRLFFKILLVLSANLCMIAPMKLIKKRIMFGLKYGRVIEWIKDVRAEKPGINELFHMAIMSVRAAFTPVSKKEYFHRMYVCHHCPIFNKIRKSSRNGEQGCGCYTPYKAIAPVDCWLYEQDKTKGWHAPVKQNRAILAPKQQMV